MRNAVIVSVARTAIGKAKKGGLRDTRPEKFSAPVVQALIERTHGLQPRMVDDVILGCAMPEGEQGMNVARTIALLAGLPDSVPAATINRFCCSGSQSIAWAADMIRCGSHDIVIAGGVESMSNVPLGGNKFIAAPSAYDFDPRMFDYMGTTAETLARQYKIKREDQDAYAVESHKRAVAAINGGKFKEEIIPLQVRTMNNGRWKEFTFDTDEGPREDTTLEGLAKLRPVFDPKGTVTAGNASQINDGMAAVVIMAEEKALAMGLEPLVYVGPWTVAGVPPELMGIGPVKAVPKLMEKAGIKLEDVDLIELNEAFAVQAIACIRELNLDMEKTNVNGGAVATGHPLGATGAFLTVKIIGEMIRRDAKKGMVTMCIGGGMGFAYLLVRP